MNYNLFKNLNESIPKLLNYLLPIKAEIRKKQELFRE